MEKFDKMQSRAKFSIPFTRNVNEFKNVISWKIGMTITAGIGVCFSSTVKVSMEKCQLVELESSIKNKKIYH